VLISAVLRTPRQLVYNRLAASICFFVRRTRQARACFCCDSEILHIFNMLTQLMSPFNTHIHTHNLLSLSHPRGRKLPSKHADKRVYLYTQTHTHTHTHTYVAQHAHTHPHSLTLHTFSFAPFCPLSLSLPTASSFRRTFVHTCLHVCRKLYFHAHAITILERIHTCSLCPLMNHAHMHTDTRWAALARTRVSHPGEQHEIP